jgi:two-component system cell cycle sensor histidine kinase/response regulator CckA
VVLDGQPIIVTIAFDISARKRAEKEQENLKLKLANAIEMANLGPWEYDVASDLFTFNDHFYKIFGTTARQVGGYTMSPDEYARRFVHPDNFSVVGEATQKAIEATDPHFNLQLEHLILCADGTVGCITVRIFIVKDANGQTVKVYGVNQNITERKRAEERLRKSEEKLARSRKMEALGLLAGGVAHDLNNILGGVINYPELMLLNLPKDSELRKPLETIQQTGNRAVAIVQDLLTVARGVAVEKKPLNLNSIISAYLGSAEHQKLLQYHPAVTISFDLDPRLLNIKGSRIHIGKAVMNLVSNAAEAITGNGKVVLSTSNRYIDQPLKGYDDVHIGEYVVLTVSDNGPGISPDDLNRIFEPFYTKKMMGRSGTGLGLAVVWNVIQDHKGYIDITTNENGTTFELYFPITRDEIFKEGITLSIGDYKGDGESVLIVDDVETQRDISCRMLEMLGYKAIPVSSGEEAVEYVTHNKVDMILLDMIMDPGINGRETYERILKIHPNQKAVIVSGFAETDEVKKAQQLGAGRYLRKPVLLEKLGVAIKEELA